MFSFFIRYKTAWLSLRYKSRSQGGTTFKFLSENVANANGSYTNYTKADLIEAFDGATDISTEVAKQIRNGDIRINVIGDELYEKMCPMDCINADGYFKEGQVYLRKNSVSLLSDLVHEANHAIDYYNRIHQSIYQAEFRSYKAEQLFQIEKNIQVDFVNDDEILVHIYTNYENGIFDIPK